MLKCYRTNIEFWSAPNSVARQKGLYEDNIWVEAICVAMGPN